MKSIPAGPGSQHRRERIYQRCKMGMLIINESNANRMCRTPNERLYPQTFGRELLCSPRVSVLSGAFCRIQCRICRDNESVSRTRVLWK